MLNINIYTRNEGSKVKFSKIFVGAKSVFLKSVGAAAPTAPTLKRPLIFDSFLAYLVFITNICTGKHSGKRQFEVIEEANKKEKLDNGVTEISL